MRALPGLGVRRAIFFGSLARGDVGGQSDLDLIFIADTRERFPERCRRFYEALAPRVGMDVLVYTLEEFEAMRGTSVAGSGRKRSQAISLRSGRRTRPGTFGRGSCRRPTRYPNTLPGGLPAHAFVRPDAERALDLAREVIAVVKRRLR